MRIVAGLFKGRKLATPQRDAIRPTSDRLRGAMFNALLARGGVEGAHVLDAFCGTGALGLEALSRGAAFCWFMDNNAPAMALARQNAATLGCLERCAFMAQDALRFEPPPTFRQKADLVFLDPPYRKNLVAPTLHRLLEKNAIADPAWIVAEAEAGASVSWLSGLHHSFSVQATKNHGAADMVLLRYAVAQLPE